MDGSGNPCASGFGYRSKRQDEPILEPRGQRSQQTKRPELVAADGIPNRSHKSAFSTAVVNGRLTGLRG